MPLHSPPQSLCRFTLNTIMINISGSVTLYYYIHVHMHDCSAVPVLPLQHIAPLISGIIWWYFLQASNTRPHYSNCQNDIRTWKTLHPLKTLLLLPHYYLLCHPPQNGITLCCCVTRSQTWLLGRFRFCTKQIFWCFHHLMDPLHWHVRSSTTRFGVEMEVLW